MEEKKEKKSLLGGKFFQKLKGIKHIEIVVALVLGAIMLLIYISSLSSGTNKQSSTQSVTSISSYSNFLENKLANVLSQIEGAGNVSTMITFESGTEYIYATDEETKTNTNSTSGGETTSQTTIKTPKEDLLVKEVLPKISGVVVVATGARDAKVKLEIVKAVQAVLDVPISKIEVLIGK